jgi:hypothetical protein
VQPLLLMASNADAKSKKVIRMVKFLFDTGSDPSS